MKDSQRQKVYDAEHFLQDVSHRFESLDEMQRYADNFIRSKWFRKRYWIKTITIKSGAGFRKATCYGTYNAVLYMPVWSRTEAVLLHEIAHAAAPASEMHGREFARIFVELVGHKMGQGAASRLKDSFRAHGVTFTRARTRKPLSEEQRAAACERLAVARVNRRRAEHIEVESIEIGRVWAANGRLVMGYHHNLECECGWSRQMRVGGATKSDAQEEIVAHRKAHKQARAVEAFLGLWF